MVDMGGRFREIFEVPRGGDVRVKRSEDARINRRYVLLLRHP